MKREDLTRILNYNAFQASQIRQMMAENKTIGRDNEHLERELKKLEREEKKLKGIQKKMNGKGKTYVKRK